MKIANGRGLILRRIVLALLLGLGCILLGTAVLSWAVYAGWLGESWMGYVAYCVVLVASFVGARFAATGLQLNKWVGSAAGSGLLWATMCILGVILYGRVQTEMVANLLPGLAGASLSALSIRNKKSFKIYWPKRAGCKVVQKTGSR